MSFSFFKIPYDIKKIFRTKLCPSSARRDLKRSLARAERKRAERLAREALEVLLGYSPTRSGYDAATIKQAELVTPVQGVPNWQKHSASTADYTGSLAATSVAQLSPPPTGTAASHLASPPTELSAADSKAFFDEIVDLYVRLETLRKLPEEKPLGRTLDDLLQSPIWELELTCSPIKVTLKKSTPQKPRPFGRQTSRQLFPEDNRENQAPAHRLQRPGHHARIAPGQRVQRISPFQEDPQTRR